MAKPQDPWAVVETIPVEAPKEAPRESSMFSDVQPLPEHIANPSKPSAEADASQTPAARKLQDMAIGTGAGALKGLIEKYMITTDAVQKQVYERALVNTLREAGIDVMQARSSDDLISMAQDLMTRRTAGAEAQLANVNAAADALGDVRASGAKVAGDSGVKNWTKAMAGQQHQMPEAILNQVQDMTKDNPKGGQALINKDLEAQRKIQQLGHGDYELAGKGRSQLQLPPQEAAKLESDAKAALDVLRPQRLAIEAEIQRLQRVGGDVTDLINKLNGLKNAENAAIKKIGIAKNAQLPMFAETGYKAATKFPVLGNALSGLSAGSNIDEMLTRMPQDPLGAAVYGVSGGLNVMSMVPAVNPASAAVKGLGTVGSLLAVPGTLAFEYMRRKGMIPAAPSVMEKSNPEQNELDRRRYLDQLDRQGKNAVGIR
jgi:hypothetical protein